MAVTIIIQTQTPTTITFGCGNMEAGGTRSIAITTGNTMVVITEPIAHIRPIPPSMGLHFMAAMVVDFTAVTELECLMRMVITIPGQLTHSTPTLTVTTTGTATIIP